jgi:AmiR/NasT family two-component response regulator
MERHGIDERAAFERLRGEARSSRRKLLEVVDELLST